MKTCLNLGAGLDIRKSNNNEKWVNLDNASISGIDINHDLDRFPYLFKDNEFDYMYCSHVLEHVADLEKTLKEISRISKKNAIIEIRVPHFSCGVSYSDPTHKRLFSYFTFDYFTDECFYTKIKFKILFRKLNFTRQNFTFLNYIFNPFINLSPLIYERFFCWIFPAAEVIIKIQPKK